MGFNARLDSESLSQIKQEKRTIKISAPEWVLGPEVFWNLQKLVWENFVHKSSWVRTPCFKVKAEVISLVSFSHYEQTSSACRATHRRARAPDPSSRSCTALPL